MTSYKRKYDPYDAASSVAEAAFRDTVYGNKENYQIVLEETEEAMARFVKSQRKKGRECDVTIDSIVIEDEEEFILDVCVLCNRSWKS